MIIKFAYSAGNNKPHTWDYLFLDFKKMEIKVLPRKHLPVKEASYSSILGREDKMLDTVLIVKIEGELTNGKNYTIVSDTYTQLYTDNGVLLQEFFKKNEYNE